MVSVMIFMYAKNHRSSANPHVVSWISASRHLLVFSVDWWLLFDSQFRVAWFRLSFLFYVHWSLRRIARSQHTHFSLLFELSLQIIYVWMQFFFFPKLCYQIYLSNLTFWNLLTCFSVCWDSLTKDVIVWTLLCM